MKDTLQSTISLSSGFLIYKSNLQSLVMVL